MYIHVKEVLSSNSWTNIVLHEDLSTVQFIHEDDNYVNY